MIKQLIDKLLKIVYNKKMSNENTIMLVSEPENARAILFKDLLSEIDTYDLAQGSFSPNHQYNIFFNFSGFQNDKSILVSNIIELQNQGVYTILDLSDEKYLETYDVDYYLFLASAANFITCSSETIQESLYDLTGRLAYLIPQYLTDDQFKTPSFIRKKEPIIYWYGEPKDIMSIRPYLTTNQFGIKIASTSYISNTKDRADTTIISTEKNKEKVLNQADIIYLPPTYTKEGEFRRYQKVEEATLYGKFVIAPDLDNDWDNLSLDLALEAGIQAYKDGFKDLKDYVLEKQDILKQKYSKETIKNSLSTSIALASESSNIYEHGSSFISDSFL